jgi:hypothetical protein
MGFFSSSPDDDYISLYVRLNPGATKAGAKAYLEAIRSLGAKRAKEREENFDRENPDATNEQRKFALSLAENKALKLSKEYAPQLKAWDESNKRLETMHWENVAAGKISAETPSPRMLFEDSLALTKDEAEFSLDNKMNGQNDIVEKITKLKTLCEAGLISQEEFEVKKKELLDNF